MYATLDWTGISNSQKLIIVTTIYLATCANIIELVLSRISLMQAHDESGLWITGKGCQDVIQTRRSPWLNILTYLSYKLQKEIFVVSGLNVEKQHFLLMIQAMLELRNEWSRVEEHVAGSWFITTPGIDTGPITSVHASFDRHLLFLGCCIWQISRGPFFSRFISQWQEINK